MATEVPIPANRRNEEAATGREGCDAGGFAGPTVGWT
jgi:hypothetical protein